MAGPYGSIVGDNASSSADPAIRGQQGVFASQPLQSPKYARNQGLRDAEFRNTLARIYVSLADASPAVQKAYHSALPSQVQGLGQVLLGNNNAGASGFVDFLLGQATETVQEVMQVEKVISDDYVAFFFGQQPPVFQYSGFLINSQQDDQRVSFYQAYRELLRGTALARAGALARLRYDSVIVSGVMIAHQQQLNADNELAIPFSFQFLVKEYLIIPAPQFQHTSASDFVEWAVNQAVKNLGSLQRPSDVRVRTAAILPPNQSALSTAGPEPASVVSERLNPMTQTILNVTNFLSQSSSASSNIRGNIDGTDTTPLPPFVPSF